MFTVEYNFVLSGLNVVGWRQKIRSIIIISIFLFLTPFVRKRFTVPIFVIIYLLRRQLKYDSCQTGQIGDFKNFWQLSKWQIYFIIKDSRMRPWNWFLSSNIEFVCDPDALFNMAYGTSGETHHSMSHNSTSVSGSYNNKGMSSNNPSNNSINHIHDTSQEDRGANNYYTNIYESN